jgi:hypothetical protein
MNVVRLSAPITGGLYPARRYSSYWFLLEAESTPGPKCGRNSSDSIGIDPATLRLVAQCLDELHHRSKSIRDTEFSLKTNKVLAKQKKILSFV